MIILMYNGRTFEPMLETTERYVNMGARNGRSYSQAPTRKDSRPKADLKLDMSEMPFVASLRNRATAQSARFCVMPSLNSWRRRWNPIQDTSLPPWVFAHDNGTPNTTNKSISQMTSLLGSRADDD